MWDVFIADNNVRSLRELGGFLGPSVWKGCKGGFQGLLLRQEGCAISWNGFIGKGEDNTNSTFTSHDISQEGQEVQSINDGTNGSVIGSHSAKDFNW
jgi:hypothetical protein